MDHKLSTRLLTDVFGSRNQDIQCDVAWMQMGLSADANLDTEKSQSRYPALWRHFAVCADCAAEYQDLLTLLQLEATNQLVRPAYIPPAPIRKANRWKEALRARFPGFSPQLAVALTRGKNDPFEPVTIEFDDGALVLELDLICDETNQKRRELLCTLHVTDIGRVLEGATLHLESSSADEHNYLAVVDRHHHASMVNVIPDNYTLYWTLAGQQYLITELLIV